MRKLTLQNLVDRNYQHFIVDEAPWGWDENRRVCVYRSGDKQCAIGCALPKNDHKFDHYMGSVGSLASEHTGKDFLNARFDAPLEALKGLQQIHDRFAQLTEQEDDAFLRRRFAQKLFDFADTYNLERPDRHYA